MLALAPEPLTMSVSPATVVDASTYSEGDHEAAHLLLSVSPQNGPFRGRSDSDLGLLWCVPLILIAIAAVATHALGSITLSFPSNAALNTFSLDDRTKSISKKSSQTLPEALPTETLILAALRSSYASLSTNPSRPTAAATKRIKDALSKEREGWIGDFSPEDRKKLLRKFLMKRQRRVWGKKVRYDVRKDLATSRARVKGRFVSAKDHIPQ